MGGRRMIWKAWRAATALAALWLVVAGCASGTDAEQARPGGDAPAQPSSSVPSTAPAPPSSVGSACPPSGVVIVMGSVDGAMGLRVSSLRMTNCGTQPYTVEGYPVVVLLDDERQPFDVQVLHGAEPITNNDGYCTASGQFDDGAQPVTLAPGQEAVAGIVWRNLTTDELDLLVAAPYLSVAPTAGVVSQELAADGVIDLGTTGRLGVSAWRPSTTETVCS